MAEAEMILLSCPLAVHVMTNYLTVILISILKPKQAMCPHY